MPAFLPFTASRDEYVHLNVQFATIRNSHFVPLCLCPFVPYLKYGRGLLRIPMMERLK